MASGALWIKLTSLQPAVKEKRKKAGKEPPGTGLTPTLKQFSLFALKVKLKSFWGSFFVVVVASDFFPLLL